MIRRLLGAPAIKASWFYGASGVFFVVATLVMARVLDATSFGLAALAIALTNVGVAGAPSGINGVWLRYDLRADAAMFRYATVCVGTFAAGLGLFGLIAYQFDWAMALVVSCAVLTGGVASLGLVPFQKAQRFGVSVPLGQIGNLCLLVAAAIMSVAPVARAEWLPTFLSALGTTGVAIWTWRHHLGQKLVGGSIGRQHWAQAFHFGSVSIGADVLMQLERLLIPFVLSITDLALYAVVAAVALAPFNVLQASVGATLVPRLQVAAPGTDRRRLLLQESLMFLVLCVVAGAFVLALGPFVIEWSVGKDQQVPIGLVLAVAVTGCARVFAAIARSIAFAFGSSQELQRFSIGVWIATAVAVALGWALGRLGLIELVLGVGTGWLLRGLIAFVVAARHLDSSSRD